MRAFKTLMQAALWVSAALLISTVQANDSSAVIGAGGLVLTQSDAIAMQQEDLFVSETKIKVDYKFRNTSNRAVTTRVAFPLPELPAETDMDLSADPQAANPMKFIPEIMGVLSRAMAVFWCCFNRFFADFNWH